MAAKKEREGLAERGSQLQMQFYVNRARNDLSKAILAKLPDLASQSAWLQWVSPVKVAKYAEHWDRAFLVAVEREDLWAELREWWPSGGAHWDALAIARDHNGRHLGPVMVEAKSYPGEMTNEGGTQAGKSGTERGRANLAKIEEAIRQTRRWLDIPDSYQKAWVRGPHYQAANRLAHLCFFRREQIAQPAWLVHVYFVDDPIKKTSTKAWTKPVQDGAKALGTLDKTIPGFASVFLPADPDAGAILRAPLRPDGPQADASGKVKEPKEAAQ